MDQETIDKIARVGEIYTPSYPIEIIDLFSGRELQFREITSAITQKGRQIIIYGDRGVGKTSFANIVRALFQSQRQVSKVSCNSDDTFETLWHNIMSKLKYNYIEAKQAIGFGAEIEETDKELIMSNLYSVEQMTIPVILQIFELLRNPIVIIDEFDRLDSERFQKKLFTDLIKAVSDTLPNATIIIVGVSEDVGSLIHEHASIERNLGQIYMPTMSAEEIKTIIRRGENELGIKFSKNVIEKIVELSSGYPHFTHALCNFSAITAILVGSEDVVYDHLLVAIRQTVNSAHESLKESYRNATLATKKNIFQEVLYSAALVETDEYGYFQANDLEEVLSTLTGQQMRVNNFTFHLGKFCLDERGEIFKVTGARNRHRYKFKNPLMKAFILLKMEAERAR